MTIVADNRETLVGLEAYLRRAGLTTTGTKLLEHVLETCPAGVSFVVLFPDEFGADAVLGTLATLRQRRPRALVILVTKEPRRYESLPSYDDGAPEPLVVPKPVWGWTILDAIRARLDHEPPEGLP